MIIKMDRLIASLLAVVIRNTQMPAALAITAARSVDSQSGFCWLLYLDEPRAIAGWTLRFCNRFFWFHAATLPLVASQSECAPKRCTDFFTPYQKYVDAWMVEAQKPNGPELRN
jgi:hypothetical protein